MLKVLFLAANPADSSPLRLAEEQREIQLMLESSERRADLELTSAFAVRPSDLLRQMNKIRPQILHFSGHGASSGAIILESDSGEAKAVAPGALKALFNAFRPELQVVVLNSCYSATQANAFTEIVDAVIAMKDTIKDEPARIFASAFYSALGFGRSISESFEQGKTAILLQGVDDVDVPILLHRQACDPSKLTLETSRSLMLSVDPNVPERLRKLLREETRLIALNTPNSNTAKSVFFELALRESKTTFVVQVDSQATIHSTAEALAAALISEDARHHYEWELVADDQNWLPSHHTIEMAGVRSGDRLYLLGNHKRPNWRPSLVR
jgi:hypothetical protein